MRNHMLAAGVGVAGVAVLVALLTGNLFGIAPDFEELTDGFRPVMEDDALEAAHTDVDALAAVDEEFRQLVMPQLAGALGMDEAELDVFLQAQFPSVAAGIAALPDIVLEFGNVVAVLETQQDNFELADQIPASNLPATTMPWILLAVVVGTATAAYVMWRAPRAGGITASVFGVVVIIGVLALSFLPKANAADDMNDALMPVYNQELVDGAKGAVGIVGAMGNEMQTGMLPALAEQMSLSAEELEGFLAQFPATAAALEALPQALGRFQVMVDTFDQQLANYESIQRTRLTPIAWTLLLAGVATAMFGVSATTRRPRLRDEIAEAERSRVPEPV